DERVLAAEQVCEPPLDLLVQHRAAEEARPARMRPPLLEVLGDAVHDRPLEVESEVVAGGEVDEPALADPDAPALDLVDHRVGHRIRPLQLCEVFAGGKPLVDPARRGAIPRVGSDTVPRCRRHVAPYRKTEASVLGNIVIRSSLVRVSGPARFRALARG